MPAVTYVSSLVRAHLRTLAPLPREELAELKAVRGALTSDWNGGCRLDCSQLAEKTTAAIREVRADFLDAVFTGPSMDVPSDPIAADQPECSCGDAVSIPVWRAVAIPRGRKLSKL